MLSVIHSVHTNYLIEINNILCNFLFRPMILIFFINIFPHLIHSIALNKLNNHILLF